MVKMKFLYLDSVNRKAKRRRKSGAFDPHGREQYVDFT